MNVDEIITLDDGKEYLLISASEINNEKYFIASEIINNEPSENYEIFKQIVDADGYSVEEEKSQEIRDILIENFENQFDEEDLKEN